MFMLSNNISFKNKTVLVTGGNRGLGKDISEYFKLRNAEVISLSSNDFDLSTENGILDLCNWINELPKLDILINNAGIILDSQIDTIDLDNFNNTFNVNVKAPSCIMIAAANIMKKSRSGKIINIASVAANQFRKNRAFYSTSKSALITLTKSFSIELAEYNILVNSVSPGFCLTDSFKQNLKHEIIEKFISLTPLGKLATPNDISKIIGFLASSDNSHITGIDIVVDGSFTNYYSI